MENRNFAIISSKNSNYCFSKHEGWYDYKKANIPPVLYTKKEANQILENHKDDADWKDSATGEVLGIIEEVNE